MASYNQWYENVSLIGKLTGNSDLAQGLEAMLKLATRNRGLAGVDKQRPWAAAVVPSENWFCAYACLPVNDLNALLEVIRPHVQDVSAAENSYTIVLRNAKRIYVAQQGGWAIVSPHSEVFRQPVADPTAMLGGLPKRYDVAVRLNVTNVPEGDSRLVMLILDQFAEREQARLPGESDAGYAGRQFGVALGRAVLKGILEEMEQVTVGLALDRKVNGLLAELILIPRPGTPAAERYARWDQHANRPAGFLLPDATVKANWSCILSDSGVRLLTSLINKARQQMIAEVESGLSAGEQSEEEKAVAGVFDGLKGLAAEHRFEGVMSVSLKPGSLKGVSAMRLPGADQKLKGLQAVLLKLWKSSDSEVGVEEDSDRDGVVRLYKPGTTVDAHTAPFQFVEGEIAATVGVGKNHVYLAFGHDCTATLKKALAASRSRPPVEACRIECEVSLASVVSALVRTARKDREMVSQLAKPLEEVPGKDHIRLTAGPVGRGMRVRVELEEGVLRLVAPAIGILGMTQ
jgi:hypothetical protein